jgi:adenosine kinase
LQATGFWLFTPEPEDINMTTLICGSLAFDTIMNFEGRFSEQILPDQLHILNVSFLVPSLRRDFGGCAGNITYALKALGGTPLPMATLGADGLTYLERLRDLGISTEFIHQFDGSYTAQAMIMTDQDNNQITAFHPGAMMQAHSTRIERRSDIKLGIISPDGREAMLQHAAQFKAADIPFVFDPGQGLPMFDGAALAGFIEQASWVTVNDYEGKMLSERTGWSSAEISRKVRGLVVTLGHEGSEVWVDGQKTHVAPVQAAAVVDPTGCGDAYRGALLYGLELGWDLARCAKLGNQLGALKIAHSGPQNYQVNRKALELQ